MMNDELWNLMPMDSSWNSKKSNKLPKWDRFFNRFAGNQFVLYELLFKKPEFINYMKRATEIPALDLGKSGIISKGKFKGRVPGDFGEKYAPGI